MGVVSFWVVDGHAVTFLINVDIFCVSCIPYVCEIVYMWLLLAFCFSFRLIFTSFMMKAFLPIPLMMILWRYFPEFYLILSIKKIKNYVFLLFYLLFYWHISLILLTFSVFRMTLFIDIYLHFFLSVSLKVLIPINWLINPRIFM